MTARTAPDPAVPAVAVRLVVPEDAAALAAFATRTFTDTYACGGPGPVATSAPHDVAAYVRAAFTPERMWAEITDPSLVTFVAGDARGAWAGYTQLRLSASVDAPPPAPCAGAHPRELARLYVDRAWQGRGVADRLVDAVVARARAEPGGADPLWLAVYQANARAVAFYTRRGFAVVGTTTFMMGAEVQHDWLMAWRDHVAPAAAPGSHRT